MVVKLYLKTGIILAPAIIAFFTSNLMVLIKNRKRMFVPDLLNKKLKKPIMGNHETLGIK